MNTPSFKSSETDHLWHSPENVLLLPSSDKTLCIPLDSIIRIEASSNYSKVFCKDQRFPIVVAKVLKWFEERLPRGSFARVH
ncbi:MAG: LytTR family transcriptional regulator DNA-binding domain-containing protein [Chitinophagales bacterium]